MLLETIKPRLYMKALETMLFTKLRLFKFIHSTRTLKLITCEKKKIPFQQNVTKTGNGNEKWEIEIFFRLIVY